MELLGLGIAIGMASVAGVRAFLALALAAGTIFFSGSGDSPDLFVQIGEWLSTPVLVVLLVLVVLEIVLDKFSSLERQLNWAMVPVRAVAGAVVFLVAVVDRGSAGLLQGPMSSGNSLTLPGDLPVFAPWLVAGAVIAGVVAVLKVLLRPGSASGGAGVSSAFLSTIEDVVAVVGGILALVVPLIPLVLVAFLLFFFFRIRKRRGRKYGGLRILGE